MSLTKFEILSDCRHFYPVEEREGPFTIDVLGRMQPKALPAFAVCVLEPPGEAVRILEADAKGCLPDLAGSAIQGKLTVCVPPEPFRLLCEEIIAWEKTHPADGLLRESQGSRSESRIPGYSWRSVFADRLWPWRRMFPEVRV